MGFISGVITGIAVAAGAAAWYMSRSGERVREQYRVEARLGEIGDQLEARTRDLQAQLNTGFAEMRTKAKDAADASTNGSGEGLDDVSASAAEAAAELAAEAETTVAKGRKAVKDAVEDATD
jgi:hypothetical protein